MLKKIISITILFLIFILVYNYYTRRVEFFLNQEVIIDKVDHPLIVLSDEDVFERFVKEVLKISDIEDVGIDLKLMNFKEKDYVLTFNKKLIELTYSPYLSRKYDFCSYLDEIPLIPIYEDCIDYMFIYEIGSKNEFRSICP